MRLEEKIRLLNGGGVPMLSPALPSTPPSSHPALDRDSFRARLSSFAPTLWYGLNRSAQGHDMGRALAPTVANQQVYRVPHLLVDLGWVDFDLGVPPSCPLAQPLLPNSNQPRQNWADSGTLKIQVNPTQSTSR